MRNVHTAVVERSNPIRGEYATEPYEVGWADEVLAFVHVRSGISAGETVTARLQIAPDGINWVDLGSEFPDFTESGLAFVKATGFGNWLRVVGAGSNPNSAVNVSIYFVLKG